MDSARLATVISSCRGNSRTNQVLALIVTIKLNTKDCGLWGHYALVYTIQITARVHNV